MHDFYIFNCKLRHLFLGLKSKYIQINIPDCWVTALFYQEVKEKLEKDVMLSCEDLEPREFNSIHDTLLTLLKQHGKELSQIMKRIDLLTLQLYSKAIVRKLVYTSFISKTCN